jgi:hypothetical protein
MAVAERGIRFQVLPGLLFVTAFLVLDAWAPTGLPRRQNPFRDPPYIAYLRERLGDHRIVGGHGIQIANYASAWRLADLRFCNSIGVNEFNQFTRECLNMKGGEPLTFMGNVPGRKPNIYESLRDRPQLYSMMGVKYMLCPAGFDLRPYDPGKRFEKVYDHEIAIYENRDVLPRVFFPAETRETPLSETWAHLAQGNVDLRHTAFVEPGFPDKGRALVSDGTARIACYEPNKVKIDVRTSGPCLVVLSDTLDPGWRATMDGRQVSIHRVNGFLRGVCVPAGEHSIRFRYAPPSFRIGLQIAALSAVAALIMACKARIKAQP